MKESVKNRTKTIILAVFIVIVASVVAAVFLATNQPSGFTLKNCDGEDCVVYLEDPGNTCTWENGQVSGSTLAYTPSESLKKVKVSKDQVNAYLKDAESTGKCTRPE